MKKIYFTAVLLFIAKNFNWAQPVINSADSHNGLRFEMFVAEEIPNLDPGTPGANKTWDFSEFQTTSYGFTETVSASLAPHSALFSTATHATHHTGVVGEIWSYYKSAPAKYEELGLVYVNIATVNMSADPRTYLEFPYTFNKTISDTYRINNGISNAFTSTYDSYGTLILPFGTFQNVIRQKNVEGTTVNYTYFNTNPVYAICTISENETSITMAKLIGSLGIKENLIETNLSAFPNPTSGIIKLKFNIADNEPVTVSASDFTGKIVSQNIQNTSDMFLDLSDLKAGIYFIKAVTDTHKSSTIKIIKK